MNLAADTQSEQCAGVDVLSHTCVVCGKEFVKRQHNQVTCGQVGCRFGRQKRAIRAEEHKQHVQRLWERRRAKSTIDLLSQTRGTKARDKYKEAPKLLVDKQQAYSRCKQCSTEFVNGEGKPVLERFAFCGESESKQGECKKAWTEAHDLAVKQKESPIKFSDPLDEERMRTPSAFMLQGRYECRARSNRFVLPVWKL